MFSLFSYVFEKPALRIENNTPHSFWHVICKEALQKLAIQKVET